MKTKRQTLIDATPMAAHGTKFDKGHVCYSLQSTRGEVSIEVVDSTTR